jgi:hypothetical protein
MGQDSITVVTLGRFQAGDSPLIGLESHGIVEHGAANLTEVLELCHRVHSICARVETFAAGLEIVEGAIAVGFRRSIILAGPWAGHSEIAKLLAAGATDCLPESFGSDELAARIRRDWLLRQLSFANAESVLNATDGRPSLTAREKQMFLLALGRPLVTFDEIRQEVMGVAKVELSTVHRAIERLREKLVHYHFDLKSIPGIGFELRRIAL